MIATAPWDLKTFIERRRSICADRVVIPYLMALSTFEVFTVSRFCFKADLYFHDLAEEFLDDPNVVESPSTL